MISKTSAEFFITQELRDRLPPAVLAELDRHGITKARWVDPQKPRRLCLIFDRRLEGRDFDTLAEAPERSALILEDPDERGPGATRVDPETWRHGRCGCRFFLNLHRQLGDGWPRRGEVEVVQQEAFLLTLKVCEQPGLTEEQIATTFVRDADVVSFHAWLEPKPEAAVAADQPHVVPQRAATDELPQALDQYTANGPASCAHCGKPTDFFAGNPALWPIWLPTDLARPGVSICWCSDCVAGVIIASREG
jgi:hypothetical protein